VSAFPDDDEADGFDTIAHALSLSPTYVARLAEAARLLVDDLFRADPGSSRRRRVLACDVAAGGVECARGILKAFARRAWRRPVAEAEVDTLLGPWRTAERVGLPAEEGLRGGLEATLISPHFIFRVETDPTPASDSPHRLTDHELATRLSYFLWSTMPDDELARLADLGLLQKDDELARQIDRLLADARADRLGHTFATRWLDVEGVESHEVNPRSFPRYTPALAASMRTEVRRLFLDFLRGGTPSIELLTARFSYVDGPLAAHYGLTLPSASAGGAAAPLQRVELAGVPRRGLLTTAAVLMTTSHSVRTSPVKRGQYVMERVLCAEVPPPPPGVETLPETGGTPTTLRQQLEAHRKQPACAGCHVLMDPIGLGLETYDAIGRYRATDRGLPIDTGGALPDGTRFRDALDLAEALARDPRAARCQAQKLATFALGRLMHDVADAAWVDHLAARAHAAGGTWKARVQALATSEAFRSRR
jgi:hypothetical protein